MMYVVLSVICVLLIEMFYWLGMMGHIQEVVSTSKLAMASLLSKSLSDREKEKTARACSLAILKHTLLFVLKIGLAVLCVLVFVFLIHQVMDLSLKNFEAMFFSWSVMIGISIFSIAYIKIRYGHLR